MTWSECLFVPLVVLFLICAQRYRESRSAATLAIMAVFTALACLTRYIGVALVPAGILVIMLAPGANFRTRFTRATGFAVLSLAPLGFWLVRNYQQAGTLSGNRFHPVFELMTNTILLVTSMPSWYDPFGLAVKSASGAGAGAVRSASLSINLFVAHAGACALAVALVLFRTARTRLVDRPLVFGIRIAVFHKPQPGRPDGAGEYPGTWAIRGTATRMGKVLHI